jgi:hypothetical protein
MDINLASNRTKALPLAAAAGAGVVLLLAALAVEYDIFGGPRGKRRAASSLDGMGRNGVTRTACLP